MFCSKCGREIPDDTKICGYCGAPSQGEWQKTEYNQTQNVYGEPKANYSGQGGSYQSGYSQNTGYGTPQNMDGGSTGMGIASMILGIVALLMSCCVNKWWLTLIVAACSIVLGILSIQKNSEGKGMAIAGIVCSCIAVLMGVIVLALGAALASFIFSLLRAV